MEFDNICSNTVTILGSTEAVNRNTGALQCMGGASILKNLHVGKEIVSNKIISETTINSGGDIKTCGMFMADKMYTITNNSIVYNYNIEPSISDNLIRRSLGSENRKWETIHAKNIYTINLNSYDIKTNDLDVHNQVSLGNINGNPLLSISSDDNTVCTTGYLIYLDKNLNRRVTIYNDSIEHDLLTVYTKNVIKMLDNTLNLSSNTVLLNLDELKNDYDIILHTDNVFLIIVEIIILTNIHKITIDILGNKLKKVGQSIRVLCNNGIIHKIY